MKKILLTCALTLASSVAFANNNTGCGLGSTMIQNQDSTFKQVIASTTNGTLGNQTFAITSGTSGCSKPMSHVSNGKLNEFVASNMDGLATDIANGHGEVVNTLAVMMGVQDKAAFIAALQSQFSEIYTSETVNSANVIDRITAIVG